MNAYTTNLTRAALGLVAGVVAGAVLVTLLDFVGATGVNPNRVGEATFIFMWAAAVWAGGLIVFALIPWYFLDHFGLRGWPVAVALGVVLTFLVVLMIQTHGFGAYAGSGSFSAADNNGSTWIDGRLTPHGWAEAVHFSSICGGIGGIVGIAVWRMAYRRLREDDHD